MDKTTASISSVKFVDRRKATLFAYRTEEEVRRALIEVIFFSCFLIVTTIIALSCHNTYEYYFNHTIGRLFLKRNSRNMENNIAFEDIVLLNDWWDFLKNTFLENIFLKVAVDNSSSREEQRHFLDVDVFLEPPRLRQIRVKPHDCFDHALFHKYFNVCYSYYDSNYEENAPVHKNTPFHSLQNNQVLPIWARIERYRGAGYVQFLTYNFWESNEIIDKLISSKWIDRATKIIIAEFVTYNNNMDLFSNIKFVVELLPTGGVVPFWDMAIVPLFSPWSITRPFLLTVLIIFYLIIFYNTINEIYEIYSSGVKSYMKNLWNYVDWFVIINAYVALVLSLLHGPQIDHYLDVVLNKTGELSSLDSVCFMYLNYKAAIAICTFLTWIRIYRFISFNETMFYFTMSLKKCAQEIFGFAIILFIFFMSFALLGLLLFGFTNPDFSSFKNSYFFMLRLMLRDFDYTNFQISDPFWGAIYFAGYILVVVFILVNMFLAIISQTYIQVKQHKQESNSAIKEVLMKFFRRILHCCRHFKEKMAAKSRGLVEPSASRMTTVTQQSLAEDALTSKKLTFDGQGPDERDETPLSTSNLKSEQSARSLSKDEALKVYFGDESSESESSTISDISLSSLDSAKSLSNNFPDTGINDQLSKIPARIDSLERAFEALKADLEHLNSTIEN